MPVDLTIVGDIPSKSNSYELIKMGKRCAMKKSDAMTAYEKCFAQQILRKHKANFEVPVEVRLDVFFKDRRKDLDGAFKGVFDCMQRGGIIKNDRLVERIVAERHIDKKMPRVKISVCEFVPSNEPTLFGPTELELLKWVELNAPSQIREALKDKILGQ